MADDDAPAAAAPAPEHASLEELEKETEELEKVEDELKSELGPESQAPAT